MSLNCIEINFNFKKQQKNGGNKNNTQKYKYINETDDGHTSNMFVNLRITVGLKRYSLTYLN